MNDGNKQNDTYGHLLVDGSRRTKLGTGRSIWFQFGDNSRRSLANGRATSLYPGRSRISL